MIGVASCDFLRKINNVSRRLGIQRTRHRPFPCRVQVNFRSFHARVSELFLDRLNVRPIAQQSRRVAMAQSMRVDPLRDP